MVLRPNAKNPWGVRVSFGSDILATLGLGHAKAHLEWVMDRLGMVYGDADVSISRADCCVDILAPDFELLPDNFVMCARTSRKDHHDLRALSVQGTSGRVTSVTVGSIRNRQVIIYDKRAEVTVRNKHHWWLIWQDTLDGMFRAGNIGHHIKLDPTDTTQSRVIRIELRAGKTALKERWNITTWADFFDRYGDLCRQTGELIRYYTPNPNDTNRARWPNHLLWEIACAEMNDDLFEMRSGVDPSLLKEVHKETHISMILRNITGCAVTHAALNGLKSDDLPAHLASLAQEITANLAKRPDKTRKQLDAAKAKYVFITGPEKE